MKWMGVVCLVMLCAWPLPAQDQNAIIKVQVRAEAKPVAGAEVRVEERSYATDEQGRVSITVTAGRVDLTVTSRLYAPQSLSLDVKAGEERQVVVELEKVEEEVIVSATRTGRRIEEQPTRVEVLDREEVEEKMMMTPGDIVMMLNEMGGLRVQATSPSLGAASVRIQGMRGRYTRFLSDGLPLYGQQVGGLGLLQIPPMDLGQVEVIKGVSSALYGAGAMGGVVDLISRRPKKEMTREFLFNQSSRGATDGVFFLARPLTEKWSGSMLGGAHFQRQDDVNNDGWADLSSYQRGIARPRLFWDNGRGSSLFVTGGFTYEDRDGGTVENRVLPATGQPYKESLESRNFDVGAVGQILLDHKYLMSARFATGRRSHRHVFGEVLEHDKHETLFSEWTVRRQWRKHTLVGGAAFEAENYDPQDLPQFRYRHQTPGFLVQDDFDVTSWMSVSAGGRFDHHNVYGNFFSPRISALFRARGWSGRVSWGKGFFAPTPLTEETEAAGLARLKIPQPLKAELGEGFSLDITKAVGVASATVTLFGTQVSNPSDVQRSTYSLVNLTRAIHNTGVEALVTFRPGPFNVVASYTYVQATKFDSGQRVEIPLTPRHSAGVVGMWEKRDRGRVGVELYYTGRQRLEDNPFRQVSEPYFICGFLAERRFGRVRAFINAENLTGIRQTKWDPLLRPSRDIDGRWTVDAWAPLDGRTFNGGVRLSF
jgi:outer membrane receptor for ferrienterochelin and colicins